MDAGIFSVQPNTHLDTITLIKIYGFIITAYNQRCFSACTYKSLSKNGASNETLWLRIYIYIYLNSLLKKGSVLFLKQNLVLFSRGLNIMFRAVKCHDFPFKNLYNAYVNSCQDLQRSSIVPAKTYSWRRYKF